MKKFTAIILALVLTLSLTVPMFALDPVSTNISILIDSSQINVTVPLNAINITAKVNGGEAVVPEGYQIVNTSDIPIRVEKIAVEIDDTNWVFADNAIAEGTASTVADKNQIFLSVNDMVLAERDASAPTNAEDWNMAAGETLALPLVCSTSQLNTVESVTNLITITYTISAGTNS